MPDQAHHSHGGVVGFFSLGVRYDTLTNHYQTIFILMQEHHWSWSDIQNMVPFERDIYLILLTQWLKEKAEREKVQRGV